VRLFRRLPRGLGLTEAGAAYAARLGPAWDEVARATAAARSHGRRKAIRLSVMPTFAANWLVPRLGRFHARHAGIEIELETAADLVDLQTRLDLDGAIRLGKGPWPGAAGAPILPADAVPVASPQLCAVMPALRHPRDLLAQPLIGTDHQPAFWREWFAAAEIDATLGQYRSFDNLQVVHEAAAAGLGIALGIDAVVRPYIESGRLRRVFPDPVRLPRHFHLLRRMEDRPGRAFQLFQEWLVDEAAFFASAWRSLALR